MRLFFYVDGYGEIQGLVDAVTDSEWCFQGMVMINGISPLFFYYFILLYCTIRLDAPWRQPAQLSLSHCFQLHFTLFYFSSLLFSSRQFIERSWYGRFWVAGWAFECGLKGRGLSIRFRGGRKGMVVLFFVRLFKVL